MEYQANLIYDMWYESLPKPYRVSWERLSIPQKQLWMQMVEVVQPPEVAKQSLAIQITDEATGIYDRLRVKSQFDIVFVNYLKIRYPNIRF